MTQTAPRPTRAFGGRIFRLGLIALGVFLLVAIAAVAVIAVMTSSRNQPMSFDIYPGAQLASKEDLGKGDRQMYTTGDSVQDVLNFYVGKLGKDDQDPRCRKIYTTDPPSEDPGKYFGRCAVDNSMLGTSQTLQISIGVQNTSGKVQTTIIVERSWGG